MPIEGSYNNSKTLLGFVAAIFGHTPIKNITTSTFTTIPITLTKAYLRGLPSCRSLAKGNVASVSKKIIPVSQTKYSGCAAINVASASCFVNNNSMPENNNGG